MNDTTEKGKIPKEILSDRFVDSNLVPSSLMDKDTLATYHFETRESRNNVRVLLNDAHRVTIAQGLALHQATAKIAQLEQEIENLGYEIKEAGSRDDG